MKCLHVPLLVPRLAVPADVSGSLVYTADSMSIEYPPIPSSPTTFAEWRDQLRTESWIDSKESGVEFCHSKGAANKLRVYAELEQAFRIS